MKREPFTTVDDSERSLRIGAIVHPYVHTRHRPKGASTVVETLYRCALCPPPKPWANPVLRTSGKLHEHILKHAEKDEAKYSREMAKECGMSEPIPGQLGLDGFGIGVVTKKEGKK